MSKKDNQMFEGVRHLFAKNLSEHTEAIPENILDMARELREDGLDYKSIVNNILDWPLGRQWFKSYNGNEFDLRQELEEILEKVEESKINETTDIENLSDAQLYVQRDNLNLSLSKSSPSDKKIFTTKRITAINSEIAKRGLSENKINEASEELIAKCKEFLKQNPNPADEKVHEFAKSLGIETDEVEAAMYKLATVTATESKVNEGIRKIGDKVHYQNKTGEIVQISMKSEGGTGVAFYKVKFEDGKTISIEPEDLRTHHLNPNESKVNENTITDGVIEDIRDWCIGYAKKNGYVDGETIYEMLANSNDEVMKSLFDDIVEALKQYKVKVHEAKINEQLPNEEPIDPKPDIPNEPSGEPGPEGEPGEEEEPVIDQSKIKEIPASGEEKEYLGSKGNDQYFYLKTVYGNAGEVNDLLLLDASEKQLLAAKEINLDPTDVTNFILTSIKKAEITLVSVDIIEKYILKPQEEEEIAKEEKPEEVGKDLERQTPEVIPAITKPGEEAPEVTG